MQFCTHNPWAAYISMFSMYICEFGHWVCGGVGHGDLIQCTPSSQGWASSVLLLCGLVRWVGEVGW